MTSWKEESLYYDEDDNLNKDLIKNTWKGYSFDAINKGYLFPSKYKKRKLH